jgi:hypothetical protein
MRFAMDRNMSHVSVFVSRELRDAIERSAAENDRSLSAEVRVALRAYTARSSDAFSPAPRVPWGRRGQVPPLLGNLQRRRQGGGSGGHHAEGDGVALASTRGTVC